jgi:hypothetical protein
MIDKEKFFLQKYIVTWLMENGLEFAQAMSIVSFSEQTEKCIPQSYIELTFPNYHSDKPNPITENP